MKTQYAGRQPGVVPKTLHFDRNAVVLLERMAPHRRCQGQFLSGLIFAEFNRREERARLRKLLEENDVPQNV